MMMAAMNITTKVAISLGSAEREYSGTVNFSSGKLRRCALSDGVALSGIMKISTSGASSLSLSISTFFPKNEVRVGLLPITIFVEPLTLAYSAICVAASSP